MKNLLLAGLLFTSLMVFSSEPYIKGKITVTGKIFDKLTSSPVEYANILLYRSSDSVMLDGSVSDTAGKFFFKDLPAGRYYMAVSFIGYKKKYLGFDLSKISKSLELDTILLETAGTELTEVNIRSSQDPVISKIDKKIIDASLELSSAGGTALDLLRNVPSVTIDGEGNIAIRGNPNFRLLVNGRPSLLQGSEGLQQISAASVKNIEIITNPSAKYDPDGNAGIINVILKKEKKKGVSGSANASAGLNRKYTIDGILNYNKNSLNIYGGIDFQSRCNQPYSLYYREIGAEDSIEYIRYETFRTSFPINLLYRFGIDYSFDENNDISFNADYNNLHYQRDFDTHTRDSYSFSDSINYNRILDTYRLTGNLLNASIYYNHKFSKKGAELSSSVAFACLRNHGNETTDQYTAFPSYETENVPAYMNTDTITNKRELLQIKSDLTLPFGNDSKIEGGIQFENISRRVISDYDSFDESSGNWTRDTLISFDLSFHQNVTSAYVMFSGKILKFDFVAGLRAEYYYRNLEQAEGKPSFPMEQFNFFPSFTLSKNLPSEQEISLSYSRRVNRPDERSLNPYPFFTDAYTWQTGNPYLKPEFTNSFELNYRNRSHWGVITVNSYYRQVKDEFYQTFILLPDNKLWLYPDNIGRDLTYGVEINITSDIFKWWKISPAVNLMHSTWSCNLPGTEPQLANTVADVVLTSTFTIKETTKIQLNTGYMSPQKNIMGDFDEIWNISVSARKDFFKKKFAVTLSIRDLLSTNHEYFVLNRPGVKVEGAFYPESPSVILSLNYKFNDYKPGKKPVQTGSDSAL